MNVWKTIWSISRRLVQSFLDDDINALAAESTYYFILGLIPFLIFFANGMLFFAAPQMDVILRLIQYLPSEVSMVIAHHVSQIVQARSSLWMILGLFLALWTFSNGVDTLIRGMDQICSRNRNVQSYVWVKGKSLVFTLFLSMAMIVSLLLMVFGNAMVYGITDYLSVPPFLLELWTLVKFGIPFGMIAFSLSFFYYLAPKQRKRKGKLILCASLCTTCLWIGLTWLYSYYMLHISTMGVTYGSLIGLVVLFIWFHLTALVILLGGELIRVMESIEK